MGGLLGESSHVVGGGVGDTAGGVQPRHREHALGRLAQGCIVLVGPLEGLVDRPAEGVPVDLGRGPLAVAGEHLVRERAVVAGDGEAAVVQRVVGAHGLAGAAAELFRSLRLPLELRFDV